mgnify:CR=1 FL=1
MPAVPSSVIEPIWVQFEALIPPRVDEHPLGCHRPRIADRVIFDKLVQVLVLGAAYIKIADSTAQVWFGAQHSHTREAIEASLPQLREMFAEQGIRLAHAQVDSGTDRRPPDQQQGFNEAPVGRNGWQQASPRSSLPDALTPVRQAANRLLDAWA